MKNQFSLAIKAGGAFGNIRKSAILPYCQTQQQCRFQSMPPQIQFGNMAIWQNYPPHHCQTEFDHCQTELGEPMTIGTPYETTAVIVESELDAILLAQEIKRPIFIVALGSAQVKPSEELLERLALCPAVLVALDNDAAGAKAALWWQENVPGCHRTLTPSRYGKDFGEAFKNGLDLNKWIIAAMTIYASTLTTKDDEKVTQNHFMERT
jgi:hypothetical protein